MEKQLLEYVEQEFKRGVSAQMVKKALRDAGWDDRLIEEAFVLVQSKDAPPMPQMKNPADEDIAALNEAEPAAANAAGKGNKSAVIIVIIILILLVAGAAYWFINYYEPSNRDDFGKTGDAPIILDDSNNEPAVPVLPATTTAADELPGDGAAATTDSEANENEARDARRMADMGQLAIAQKNWFEVNKHYYTCGLAGGECGGKPYGYPSQIGDGLKKTPQDPLIAEKPVCGKDYVYCGLNNAPYSHFFCYYAKLETGGYYTASHAGNFRRSNPPKIFEECAAAE